MKLEIMENSLGDITLLNVNNLCILWSSEWLIIMFISSSSFPFFLIDALRQDNCTKNKRKGKYRVKLQHQLTLGQYYDLKRQFII